MNSGEVYERCLVDLVTSGRLLEEAIDDAVRRTLKLRFDLGLVDPTDDEPYWHVAPSEVNTVESREPSLAFARKPLVLLSNNDTVLPLSKGKKIAVIGSHAMTKRALLRNHLGQKCPGD